MMINNCRMRWVYMFYRFLRTTMYDIFFNRIDNFLWTITIIIWTAMTSHNKTLLSLDRSLIDYANRKRMYQTCTHIFKENGRFMIRIYRVMDHKLWTIFHGGCIL